MRLGIKVGPDNWQPKLDNDLRIGHAEVYFNFAYIDAYAPLFEWLREREVQAGLHASTVFDGGMQPNLASPDDGVRRASALLLRRTIDVAAGGGLRFVVVHPGSYQDWGIRDGRTFLTGERASAGEGAGRAIEEVLRLSAYGRSLGVELLAENLPAYDYASYEPLNRGAIIDPGFLPYGVLRTLGEQHVSLCVDVGHLYAEMAAASNPVHSDRFSGAVLTGDRCFAQVMAATRELAPYARHVHLSTTVPPWNGTDSHNGFLPGDYARGAAPDREQLLAWLGLFAGRDVCAIPEPEGGAEVHLANYCLLSAWLEQLP